MIKFHLMCFVTFSTEESTEDILIKFLKIVKYWKVILFRKNRATPVFKLRRRILCCSGHRHRRYWRDLCWEPIFSMGALLFTIPELDWDWHNVFSKLAHGYRFKQIISGMIFQSSAVYLLSLGTFYLNVWNPHKKEKRLEKYLVNSFKANT